MTYSKDKLLQLWDATSRSSVGKYGATRKDTHASNSKKHISSYGFASRKGLIEGNRLRMTIVTDGPGYPDVKIAK